MKKMEEWGDLGQMVTAPTSSVRDIETILLHWGSMGAAGCGVPDLAEQRLRLEALVLQQGNGGGSVPLALEVKNLQEVSRSCHHCLPEMGGEGEDLLREKVLCSTCFTLLSLSEMFFLQARPCLGERPRWTWREAKVGGRRPLRSEEGVDDAFILESPSLPPLEPPYPRVGEEEVGRGRRRGQGLVCL